VKVRAEHAFMEPMPARGEMASTRAWHDWLFRPCVTMDNAERNFHPMRSLGIVPGLILLILIPERAYTR
jgi:hypothetical protein